MGRGVGQRTSYKVLIEVLSSVASNKHTLVQDVNLPPHPLPPTHPRPHTITHTHTLSLSRSLSLTHTHTQAKALFGEGPQDENEAHHGCVSVHTEITIDDVRRAIGAGRPYHHLVHPK